MLPWGEFPTVKCKNLVAPQLRSRQLLLL